MEVMFAIAVFSFVAVLSITIMNNSVAQSEASLELVVSRNELNAQAEAIRFVHDSYVDEATLPTCGTTGTVDAECQQYRDLWRKITSNAISLSELKVKTPLSNCNDVYSGSNSLLRQNKAFVLNPRNIAARDAGSSYIDYEHNSSKFVTSPLNARIVYGTSASGAADVDTISNSSQLNYNVVQSVQGMWVIAVKGDAGAFSVPKYYDFYIQSCWNPPTGGNPTSIDTVIRLYNPEGM